MLIYAAADIHGRKENMRTIQRIVATHRPDGVVLAGDITRRRRPAAVFKALNQLDRPVLMVHGNSDPSKLQVRVQPFSNLQAIHLMKAKIRGVAVVGIGGTLPLPFCCRLGMRESAIESRAAALLDPGDVLVVHAPPYGARDRVLGRLHAGSRAVRRLVAHHSPALVICGHIHEQAGIEKIGETVVVNCALGRYSNGALIDYDGGSVPVCRMLTSES